MINLLRKKAASIDFATSLLRQPLYVGAFNRDRTDLILTMDAICVRIAFVMRRRRSGSAVLMCISTLRASTVALLAWLGSAPAKLAAGAASAHPWLGGKSRARL